MKKQFLLLMWCVIGLGTMAQAQDNVPNFPIKFAFRQSDTLRQQFHPTTAGINTSAFIYNPVVNEFWAANSHSDSIFRLGVPRGNYLGAFRSTNIHWGSSARAIRQMTVKDNYFIWAVNNTDTIKKIDPRTGQEVAKYPLPRWMGTQTMITYDSIAKGFWVSGLAYRIRLIDTTFTTVSDSLIYTITPDFPFGAPNQLVFDGTTQGSPSLWMTLSRHPEFPNLGTSGSTYTMTQVSIATKKRTGIHKAPADDFDFIINVNQFGKGACIARLPGIANPVMICHMGKFASGSSTLLASDLSGVTVGYEMITPWRQDAAIDSLATGDYSMIPTLLSRPVAVSAKVRNVMSNIQTSGNVRFEVTNNGSIVNTQSVPYNLGFFANSFYPTANTFTPRAGLNEIKAQIVQPQDPVRRNDTVTNYVWLTDSTLARDYVEHDRTLNSSAIACICANRASVFAEKPEVGQSYQLDAPVTVTSVTARIWPTRTGDTTRFKIYRLDAQRKPIYVGQTGLWQITPADSAARSLTLPLLAPVSFAANQEFMVSMTEGFDIPAVQVTTKGYKRGTTFGYALQSLGGWQLADTMASTFLKDRLTKALALRPNFRIRTGVNNIDIVNRFEVMPNPTNGLVQLNIELDNTADVLLKVYNMNGQLVAMRQLDATKTRTETLDLSDAPNGVYMVSLVTSAGVVSKKLIKQ